MNIPSVVLNGPAASNVDTRPDDKTSIWLDLTSSSPIKSNLATLLKGKTDPPSGKPPGLSADLTLSNSSILTKNTTTGSGPGGPPPATSTTSQTDTADPPKTDPGTAKPPPTTTNPSTTNPTDGLTRSKQLQQQQEDADQEQEQLSFRSAMQKKWHDLVMLIIGNIR